MAHSLLTLQSKLQAAIKAQKLHIILASASPRRMEALSYMLGGATYFEVKISDFPEKLPHSDYPHAVDYCLHTAQMKAQTVCKTLEVKIQPTFVIAADTVVAFKDQILEKPTSPEDAARMLRLLSGSKHQIHTCVTVYTVPPIHEAFAFTTTTEVKVAELSDAEIAAYIATGEPLDKAGAYAIQGEGRMLIEYIHGDFFSGVGFPARDFATRFANLLEKFLINTYDN